MGKAQVASATFFIIFLTLFLSSCKNARLKSTDGKEGRYMAKVAISAGDHIDYLSSDTLSYVTFPFNVATFENSKKEERKVFLIGTSIKKGENVSFLPVAKLNYTDEEDHEVIVGRPTNQRYITAQINDYFDLISTHYGVQKVIETWLIYSKGFDSVKSIDWETRIRQWTF